MKIENFEIAINFQIPGKDETSDVVMFSVPDGNVFMKKDGDVIHVLDEFESIKFKLFELCKTLKENRTYKYERYILPLFKKEENQIKEETV